MSQVEFDEWLHQQCEDGSPAAVVRFADAEAKIMTVERGDADSMRVAVNKLEKETGLRFSDRAVLELKESLELAFDRADLLGIAFDERQSTYEQRLWKGKLAALYAERLAAGRPAAMLVPCLLDWGKLPAALAGRRISAISCRDVKDALEEDWGAEDVNVYQVPSQYQVRDVDGSYEAAMHEVPIWPNAHSQIRSQLSVREPGEVFLVGAGVFGKDLCIHIRDQGGIALDLGSALDEIAGKLTRGPKRTVLDVYAAGMPKADLFPHFQRKFGHVASRELIAATIEEAVANETIDDLTAWRTAPLNAFYPIVHVEGFRIPLREEPESHIVMREARLAWAVDREGARVPLGIWAGEGGDSAAVEELRRRGLEDVAIACVDPGVRLGVELPSRGKQLQSSLALPPELRKAVDSDPLREIRSHAKRALDKHGAFAEEDDVIRLLALIVARASHGLGREAAWPAARPGFERHFGRRCE